MNEANIKNCHFQVFTGPEKNFQKSEVFLLNKCFWTKPHASNQMALVSITSKITWVENKNLTANVSLFSIIFATPRALNLHDSHAKAFPGLRGFGEKFQIIFSSDKNIGTFYWRENFLFFYIYFFFTPRKLSKNVRKNKNKKFNL